MKMTPDLPLPDFFQAANADRWDYVPRPAVIEAAAAAARRRHNVAAAAASAKRVHLLVIDAQRDFCNREGSLYVGGRSGNGAVEDSARIAEFIYRNAARITTISPTLDTHVPFQIFFSSFWIGRDGNPPAPGTVISETDVRTRTWSPVPALAAQIPGISGPAALDEHAAYYCAELERVGKYRLMVWPKHCVIATPGYALAGVVDEAIQYHAALRHAPPHYLTKGTHPLTENYSVFSPEVLTTTANKHVIGQRNTEALKALMLSDVVVILGQASSHCVKSSIDDLLGDILAQDPSLAKKVYIVRDCMSAVVIPGVIDFTDEAEKAFKRFEDAGMHVVKSTDPIESWPGIDLR